MLDFRQFLLKRKIRAAETALQAAMRRQLPGCRVFSFGAVRINPKHLAFWIATDTDEQKNRLLNDSSLQAQFKQLLAEAGYPQSAIPYVGLAIESQETIDRDFQGDWWSAVK